MNGNQRPSTVRTNIIGVEHEASAADLHHRVVYVKLFRQALPAVPKKENDKIQKRNQNVIF